MTWTAARIAKLAAIGAIAVMLNACASSFPSRTAAYVDTPLDRPAAQPSEAELLDVRIEAFDPGTLPQDEKAAKGLSPEIRNAETYYLPVQLRNTMQKSGHWGAVRVTPRGSRPDEITVSGKVVESNGEILKVEIEARDATGVPWFKRSYQSVIDIAAYNKAQSGGVDPFQHLYNQIANDLASYKKLLKPEDMTTIRQVSDLRFGTDFAPSAYNNYLKKSEKPVDDGSFEAFIAKMKAGSSASRKTDYTVVRLPPEDDPIVQRVSRIQTREEFLVDTLDQHYDVLAANLREPYTLWRTSRLKEIAALREADRIKNEEQAKAVAIGVGAILLGAALASQNRSGNCPSCTTGGVLIAGAGVAIGVQMAMRASEQATAETNLRKAALEEMGASLSTDVRPTVIEVEGKTVELKGSVEQKFEAWREVLRELQNNETAPLAPPPGVSS